MYLQKVLSKTQKATVKKSWIRIWSLFRIRIRKSVVRIRGSGSQWYGSVDPDPYQYVTDPQHCFLQDCIFKYRSSSFVPTSTEFRPLFNCWNMHICIGSFFLVEWKASRRLPKNYSRWGHNYLVDILGSTGIHRGASYTEQSYMCPDVSRFCGNVPQTYWA
jgi:hypothetical protein